MTRGYHGISRFATTFPAGFPNLYISSTGITLACRLIRQVFRGNSTYMYASALPNWLMSKTCPRVSKKKCCNSLTTYQTEANAATVKRLHNTFYLILLRLSCIYHHMTTSK
eukprot:2272504-Pleurochrysis_carterae.AAC.1